MQQPSQLPANLSGMQPPARAETTADSMMGADALGIEAQEATPEEQAAYERLVAKGVQLMHTPEVRRQIGQAVKSSSDTAQALGFAAGNITRRVLEAAQKEGAQIPAEAILPAATEIHEHVAELAEATGVPVDDDTLNSGYIHAVDEVRRAAVEFGFITAEQAQADLAEIQEWAKAREGGGAAGAAGMMATPQGQNVQPPFMQPSQPQRKGFGAAGGMA